MSLNRPMYSWLEQEKDEIPGILKGFWKRRIHSQDPTFNRAGFKGFIRQSYKDSGNEWTDEIDNQFEAALQSVNNFNNFKAFFDNWFSKTSVSFATSVALVIERGHLIQPKEIAKAVTPVDIDKLKENLKETKISAAISLGNANTKCETVLSENIHSSAPFQIHSLTKIFTGVLVLKMIERGYLPEEELTIPLGQSEFFKYFNEALPKIFKDKFNAHLDKVSLFQLMIHEAGFGDYYEYNNVESKQENPNSYQRIIHNAIELNPHDPKLPEIKNIGDLLQFAENDIYEIGKFHYSNVGITLVGMIIEYAYNKANPKSPKGFDELLQEILKEAGIESSHFLPVMPLNGRFNKDPAADIAAPYIVAGPAGHYWARIEDLAQFSEWLYKECMTNSRFEKLLKEYGKEFYHGDDIFHTGTLTASSSAFLSVSLKTGNIIVILCDNSDSEATPLEARIKKHIFLQPSVKLSDAATKFFKSSSLQQSMESEQSIKDKSENPYGPGAIVPYQKK